MSYDEIDPALYDRRFELIPREGYVNEHWRPLIEKAIGRYCDSKGVALDLGCGTGGYFMPMLEKVHSLVLGLDISARFLKQGRTGNQNLNLIQGDAHTLPLRTESIHAVTSNLFEYVDRNVTIKEIHRALRINGICVVLTSNKYGICGMPFKIPGKLLHKRRGNNEASKNELIGVFRKSGFELLECKMDDGLIWLADFLDKRCGRGIYLLIERLFRLVGTNPFSNAMLFVVMKRGFEGSH